MQTKQYVVYDQRGRRQGTVGGVGRGPGEFRAAITAKRDRFDTLRVSDPAQNRLSVFAPRSRKHICDVSLEARLGTREGDWLVLDDGRIVASLVGAAKPIDRLVILDTGGRVVRRVGPDADNGISAITLAPAREHGFFWRARVIGDHYVVERWTVDGSLIEIVDRAQRWWTRPDPGPALRAPPAGALLIDSIREDSTGLLWIVLLVPNESYWRGRQPDGKVRDLRADAVLTAPPYSYAVEIIDPRAGRLAYSSAAEAYPFAPIDPDLAFCPGKEDPDGTTPLVFCRPRLVK